MYTSTKGKLGLASLFFVLFLFQFFILGTFYSESTDTFWINNLMLQGINDFEIFFVFISSPLSLLYSLFPSVPFSNLLLYSLLFVLGIWLSLYMRTIWGVVIAFLVLFSEPVLLLDFTAVAILVVLLSIILFLEIKDGNNYYILGFVFIAACIRHTSIVYSLGVLVPYLGYIFLKKGFKRKVLLVIGVLVFSYGAINVYFLMNKEVASFRKQNSVRAKMVDYDREIVKSGDVNIEFLVRGLYVAGAANASQPEMSFAIGKVMDKLYYMFFRLGTTFSLYVVLILIMLRYTRSTFHWVYFCYISLFLIGLCVFYKMPNRLLLPVLSIIPLLLFFENKDTKKYNVYVLMVCVLMFTTRVFLKSTSLNKKQALQELKMNEFEAMQSYRSFGLNKDLMYLNPTTSYTNTYVSRTIPLGGWVGLLPKVQQHPIDSSILVLKNDTPVFEDWLKVSLVKNKICANCYSIKKGTSK